MLLLCNLLQTPYHQCATLDRLGGLLIESIGNCPSTVAAPTVLVEPVKPEEATTTEGEAPVEGAEDAAKTEEGKDKTAKPSDDKAKVAKPADDKTKATPADKGKAANKETKKK